MQRPHSVSHEPFDLYALVSEAVDSSGEVDAAEIAVAIANDVPAAQLREALALALTQYVHRIQSNRSRLARAYAGDGMERPSTFHSRMMDARLAYALWIDSVVRVPEGPTKRRGDVSYDEQCAIAGYRHRQALSFAASAQREDMLVAAMQDHDADYVGDLPEGAVTTILAWEPVT
jgi:hypothetical protein